MDKMSEQMVLRRQMEKIKQSKTEILECKKYTKSKKKKKYWMWLTSDQTLKSSVTWNLK